MGKYITDYFLYRWRYILGYSITGLALLGLLIIAGLYVPGGLSDAEMRSAVASHALSGMLSIDTFQPEAVVNLPYHLLQYASLSLFGVSAVSIKLPSLILSLASAVGMFVLLRTWFQQNVAVITTILVITTGQFLFIAQSGSVGIVYIFWSIWLLVAAMMISRRARFSTFWKIILFAIAALSLYTPLSLYILIALASATALHPHLRYMIRRLSKAKLMIGFTSALVLSVPLGYALFKQPSITFTLLGIPDEMPNLLVNFTQLSRQYFDFISPSSGAMMTPIYGLGSMLLIVLGIYRLVTTKYTARSYIIAAWLILLLPILVINPNFVSVTFVPFVLLMGMGIASLLSHWYRLFPRNPYARVAGLIPLSILIGGMVFSGIDRYMYGYHYDPQTANYFSNDLSIVNTQLRAANRGAVTIVASNAEQPFYKMVADYSPDITVTTPSGATTTPTIIVTQAAQRAAAYKTPHRILTDDGSRDADRFYIYKTDQK